MKKVATLVLVCTLLLACKDTPKNKENQTNTSKDNKDVSESKPMPSADYSSLFNNYECDLTPAEVAKAMDIPETNVSMAKYQRSGACAFSIKGFGQNTLGDDTAIQWFLENVGKAQVKKEIQSYLTDQANNKSVLGMGIELSETGDTYIAKIPMSGRIVIMNENYDSWLFFNYSQKGMYKSRTEDQHAALEEKTIALANYLLKKNKK